MIRYQDTQIASMAETRRIMLRGFISILATALLTGAMLLQVPAVALARVKCPEGKTASGECVEPGLGSAMRKTAVVYTQPKLSETAPPVLPVDDWTYRYPNALINDPLSRPAGYCNPVRGVCR